MSGTFAKITIGQSVREGRILMVYAASLFLRSVVALNAAILLIQSKFYDDAAIIIRTLFEIELQLSAIKALSFSTGPFSDFS
jgi:Family of unknown function (DUF5677)